MAQGLSSVETPFSLVYPRRGRRHGGSASIAWLISVLLHGVLFAALYRVVLMEPPAPRRIIIPEARLAPPGLPAGEMAPSALPPRPAEPANPTPVNIEPTAALSAAAMPTLPPLPDALPVIAAPAGDSVAMSASFVSAAISPTASGGGGWSGSGRGAGGGGPAALAGVGPVTAFFGQGGNAYKVVYVVDVSASLMIYTDEIVRQMRQSIRDLVPTQEFHIVLAKPRQVVEFSSRRLVPANARYKKEADAFLNTIVGIPDPGKSDPVEAMRRAFAVGPELIYFLTDGDYAEFNIDQQLEKTLTELNAQGGVAITTISFDPAPRSVDLLKRIAKSHHGHYRLVQFKE